MDEPLEEQYFKWLYQQVASVRLKNPARTYWSLIRHLFKKEYVYLIPNDDNRAADGRDLRNEFIEQYEIDPDPEWMDMGCSMLEMLIALSRRLAFEDEGESRDWFWHMMENLDLTFYSDLHFKGDIRTETVNNIVDRVIWRTYDFDGTGGLFPLDTTNEDQREVELWYQMNQYLLERV